MGGRSQIYPGHAKLKMAVRHSSREVEETVGY